MKAQLLFKRFFDIILSFSAIVITLPLWIIISVAIKIDSTGPVFFLQDRRTRGGRIFKMLKFRTMVVGAEFMEEGLFSYEGDRRVTRIGRYLRSTSLDELPQFVNVLMGDMSLVGPRPCEKNELGDFESLNDKYKRRFDMKGGITGLAQCMGRNGISWDTKVDLDNQYIANFQSIGVMADFKILLYSVKQVFSRKDVVERKRYSEMSDSAAAREKEEEIIINAHRRENL